MMTLWLENIIWKCSNFSSPLTFFSALLYFPFPSLFSVLPLFHEVILKHWTSFSLQLSPEEGYVSAKEDSFLYPPHSCEEEGLADKALFRADLALVSCDLAYQVFFQNLTCLIFAFQNILKFYCILCSLFLENNILFSISVVLTVQNEKSKPLYTWKMLNLWGKFS